MPDSRATKTHPLEVIILLALIYALYLFIRSALSVLAIKYGIDFGEGYLANTSLEIIRGVNPYHPIENPPWIVSSYPPLYPYLTGLLMAVTEPGLAAGRFIAVASFIGIITVAIILLRNSSINLTAAVITACLLIVFPWGCRWAQVVRVDTFGIFLSITGIYFWIRSEKNSDAVISAIFLSLAVFTKQSLLAAPLACILYGLLSRDRRFIIFLVLFVVITGGLYCVTNLVTGGGLFRHLFTYTANTWFAGRFTAGIGLYFKATWLLHLTAIGALIIPGTVTGKRRIFIIYYILSTLTLITYGFEGSDSNYLIEPLLAALLLAGFAIDRMAYGENSHEISIKGISSSKSIILLIILLIIILGRFTDTTDYRLHRMTPERYQNGLELTRFVYASEGDVLSEDASYLLLAGKQVIFQPYIMSLLSRTGKWNQDEFVQTIRDKKYSMIILRVDLNDPYNTEQQGGAWEMAGFDRWTPEMESAIMESYRIYPGGALDVGIGNLWYIYLPI